MKRIKYIIASIAALTMLAVLPAGQAFAASTVNIQGSFCNGVDIGEKPEALGTGTCDATDSLDVQGVAQTIINVFTWLVGVVAVIMIIYGGFRYITSGGDSGKVGGAKNAIIFALVGLVIVILAQVIIRFVVNRFTTT